VVLISRDFFARPSTEVAPDLLGTVIEHQTADGLVAVRLTEVEAYAGAADPASHAYHGKTRRNAVMFGPPGHAYVYFTYGMHFCVNLVCLGNGSASAVLLRAGAVIDGEDLARARRTRPGRGGGPDGTRLALRDLARGPARLCQALDIDRSLDGADVCVADSPLRMRWPDASATARSGAVLPRGDAAGPGGTTPPDPPVRGDPSPRTPLGPPREQIARGPRVGVAAAAEVPWRFWIEGDPTVSAYRAHVPRRRTLVTP
jgi:DNA-3-methyladenine glycosylase